MRKTEAVKRPISNSLLGEMKSEMNSMRREIKLLRSENLSLHNDVKTLKETVALLMEARDEGTSYVKVGADPPDVEDEVQMLECESQKENVMMEEDDQDVVPLKSSETSPPRSPPKNLGYRNRIRSQITHTLKKNDSNEEEQEEAAIEDTSEKPYLGLKGRRSQIYKEIYKIKTSPSRHSVNGNVIRLTMNT